MRKRWVLVSILSLIILIASCREDNDDEGGSSAYTAILQTFGNNINPGNLPNYESQSTPAYITKDNTQGNAISDEVATLGRVLFYDRKLSVDNQISCSNCHIQAFAFSDTAQLSLGINGRTGRHSMRLVNAGFATEVNFFWDERAASLEDQTVMPIQDHIEMGYTGENGDSSLSDLVEKLKAINYYQELTRLAFGDAELSENRMKLALAQFVRSIQSFDSKYDQGYQQVNAHAPDFPNFTAEENLGKQLFTAPPGQGGAFCAACHMPPEFDINPMSLNNGVIGVAQDANAVDLNNTRSPSLRDLVNPDGMLNGPMMHNGEFNTLLSVVEHYNSIPNDDGNTNLDGHLRRGNFGTQQLNLTAAEKQAIVAFLKTLTGSNVYTDPKYSNPFLNL